jgi:NAD(P)H dehydrogenase (quinone)
VSSPTDRRTVLITGATGDTGRAAVRESLALGLQARAMVHKKDARADALGKLGAEVVIGDLLEINTVRAAMEGVSMRPTLSGQSSPALSTPR